MARDPRLPFQVKSLLIRAIRGNNAHRSAHEPRVYFGEAFKAETGFAKYSRNAPPAPSNLRCGKERAARARRKMGALRASPHATGTMRENTFEHFPRRAANMREGRRVRLPVQAKSLLIRAIRGNNAHRSALEPRVYFGEVSNAETGFALHSRKRRPPPCGRQKEAGGEGASESALISERAFTPRDSAKSPSSNTLPAARADMMDRRRPAPAFSGQKPVTTRHCATASFDGTKRRRITRRWLRWRWLRSLRRPARSGQALAKLSYQVSAASRRAGRITKGRQISVGFGERQSHCVWVRRFHEGDDPANACVLCQHSHLLLAPGLRRFTRMLSPGSRKFETMTAANSRFKRVAT
jgi:hypothetical protein